MHVMNNDSTILALREDINVIDTQLVQLLNQRAEKALAIGKVKAELGERIYDPARENDIIDKIDALNHGPLSKGAIEEVYRAIITVCRELQMGS